MARISSKKTRRLLFNLVLGVIISLTGYQLIDDSNGVRLVPNAPPGSYNVISAEDGDTITVRMDGKDERIRFIGIDTPEVHDPRKPVQCFGQAASEFTKKLIGDSPVRLEADPLSGNRDRYDRLLRYVYLPDGRLVNAEVIKQGYGFAYTSFPFTKSDDFLDYQRQARQRNLGLWNSCQPQKNQYGGYTSNPD